MRYLKAALVVLVAAACFPAAAHAEPFAVTGGVLVFDFEGDFFTLQGSGFELDRRLPDGPDPVRTFFDVTRGASCEPCVPGERMDTSFTSNGEIHLGRGVATLGGTSYGEVTFRGTLDFRVPPFVFPDPPLDEGLSISNPFTASMFIRAFSGPTELFAAEFRGSGRTREPFSTTVGGLEREEGRLDFVFEDTAPVPEPATILLAGAGLASCWRARRRRRSGDPGLPL